MKKFLSKLIIFLILFCVVDQIYGWAMAKMRSSIHGGFTAKTGYVCDSLRADIVIFGSSRARMQYDPAIICDSLGMTCYNCGSNGMGIIYHYGAMKILSKRYMPKVVIIDILPIIDIMTRDDNSIFVNNLRPWYHISSVDSIFWTVDGTERIKMLSGMYAYHSKFLEYRSDRNAALPKGGFDPSPASKIIGEAELLQSEPTGNTPDSLKLYFLEKMIKEYRDKTKLVFVVSPRYNFRTSHTVDPLRQLCNRYGVTLLDHYADPQFVFRRNDFGDGNHMNAQGAKRWTPFIAHEIKKIVNK